MKAIKLSTISTAIIILFCSSLCMAEGQTQSEKFFNEMQIETGQYKEIYSEYGRDFGDYPVKKETRVETERLLDNLKDFTADLKSISENKIITDSCFGIISLNLLKIDQIRIENAYNSVLNLLCLESGHDAYSYDNAILLIIYTAEQCILDSDDWVESANGLANQTDFSLIVIQSDKLKSIARDAKRQMQKIVKELNETIEIAKKLKKAKLLE
jgi:hypothetical protein